MTGQAITGSYPSNPGGKNLLINGAMDVWQRGGSFTLGSGSVNGYCADRWRYDKVGTTATLTITQSTDVPTVAQADMLFNFSLLCTVNTAAVIGTNEHFSISQYCEGYNFRYFAQRPLTVSFWVKSSLVGNYSINLHNNNFDRDIVSIFAVNSANTWEKKIISFPPSPAAGTWNYGANLGLAFIFRLAVGSAFQTSTFDTWQTSTTFHGATGQQTLVGTAGATFRITGLQIERGYQATEFETMTINKTLANCQRYFYSIFEPHLVGASNGGIVGRVGAMHPVPMRANPAVSLSGTLGIYDGAVLTSASTLGTNYSNAFFLEFDTGTTAAATIAGRPVVTYMSSTGGSIFVSAEL